MGYNLFHFVHRSIVQAVLAHLKLSNVSSEKISQNLLTDQDRIIWESMSLTADIQSMENAALLTKVGKFRIRSVRNKFNFVPSF